MGVQFLHAGPNMNNIIFLDIDGVLNSTRSRAHFVADELLIGESMRDRFLADTKATIDPIAVKLINKLITDTGADIVVSSSHRWFNATLEEMQDYIAELGVVGKVIDTTMVNLSYRPRGGEIMDWLVSNSWCKNFVILDDINEFRAWPKLAERFVHTDDDIGFSLQNFKVARSILNEHYTIQCSQEHLS